MAKLLKSVQGLRVLIAGGAGSGLGGTTARQLAAGGAKVLVLDAADPTEAERPTQLPEGALFCRADVTDEAQVQAALAVAESQLGGLDAAVNCAAISFAARTYNWNLDQVTTLRDFAYLMQVNCVGTFNVARLAAQLMAKNAPPLKPEDGSATPNRGVIVNTASICAFDGQNSQVAYSASKAAVAGLTLPMSRDLAPIGIRVCCIAPGYFDSPLCRRDSYPRRLVKFLADHNRAIYRLGRPEEFAHAVEAVLLNPMLNGVNIRLDAASRGFFFNRRKKAVPLVSAAAAAADGADAAAVNRKDAADLS